MATAASGGVAAAKAQVQGAYQAASGEPQGGVWSDATPLQDLLILGDFQSLASPSPPQDLVQRNSLSQPWFSGLVLQVPCPVGLVKAFAGLTLAVARCKSDVGGWRKVRQTIARASAARHWSMVSIKLWRKARCHVGERHHINAIKLEQFSMHLPSAQL